MDFSSARIQAFLRAAKKILNFPFWAKLSSATLLMLICFGAICRVQLSRHEKIKNLSRETLVLISMAEVIEKKKEFHKKMQEQNSNAPRDYLKQTIEALSLLQGERQRVAALAKQFPDNTSLKERLQFLEGGQNKICFDSVCDGTELIHRLNHRVQMDLSDLRNFLEAVEGDRYDATRKKPFLVMKKFDLLKCYEKGDEKVYSIDVELIEKI